jgi:hypothetical protein
VEDKNVPTNLIEQISPMKNYCYLLLTFAFLGCETRHKNDLLPDVSGNYTGKIAMTDMIGVPNPLSSEYSSATLEVAVSKNGEYYSISGLDTGDLTVPVSEQRAYDVPPDPNSKKVNYAFVSFTGDSLVIQGYWRYVYLEGEYTDKSINRRNYRFIGHRK